METFYVLRHPNGRYVTGFSCTPSGLGAVETMTGDPQDSRVLRFYSLFALVSCLRAQPTGRLLQEVMLRESNGLGLHVCRVTLTTTTVATVEEVE